MKRLLEKVSKSADVDLKDIEEETTKLYQSISFLVCGNEYVQYSVADDVSEQGREGYREEETPVRPGSRCCTIAAILTHPIQEEERQTVIDAAQLEMINAKKEELILRCLNQYQTSIVHHVFIA